MEYKALYDFYLYPDRAIKAGDKIKLNERELKAVKRFVEEIKTKKETK